MADDRELTRQQWIERCRGDDPIPHWAIVEHKLIDQFMFMPIAGSEDCSLAFADATGEHVTWSRWKNNETGEVNEGNWQAWKRAEAASSMLMFWTDWDGSSEMAGKMRAREEGDG